MAGTISPSMPVWVVENKAFGNRSFCRQVEGRQQFGDYSESALQDLHRWKNVWAPSLRQGLRQTGGLPLKPIIAKALMMGDELHNRPVAASSLFANAMSSAMVEAGVAKENLVATLKYTANHELLFLGLAMACGKAIADPAAGIESSTVVVAMARNGTDFGIRVSGLGEDWFTAPSPRVKGLYFPAYKEEDAGFDMGDSAITETVGWGGFVLAGATGILSLVGGTPDEAMAYSREMRQITVGTSANYRMPVFGFQGTSLGIDIRRVVQTGITPIIDTAIAHKNPGFSIIGAGLVRAPLECFQKALVAFSRKYGAGQRKKRENCMVLGFVIRKNSYYDSVFLMRVAKTLSQQKGVLQAAALMGTEKNKGLLREIGVLGPEVAAAAPQDLIIAIKADKPGSAR